MALRTADDVYEEIVKSLPTDERLRLVERIVHDFGQRPAAGVVQAGRSWGELRGIMAYPMCGEDAQAWVTRTRRESDESREAQWRRTP